LHVKAVVATKEKATELVSNGLAKLSNQPTYFSYHYLSSDDGKNAKNVNSSTSHLRPRAKDAAGAKKESPLPAKIESSLPNILVASTISVFFVASLIVLLLVVIKSSFGPSDETNEDSSRSQRSDVVTEVTMMELKDETNNSSTLRDGNVLT